ncbi:malate/lactate/ureidoglycolate dehydrogenase [Camelimonas fluminis]|uniref:Malate/lactate/ureidoglycolate dehydrogenase n=1 Tax=Camelimonas fluminis TaxID=1576911 RepID=A0ABV7UE59_9HYPH|nr:malate/lactate/ureidoglycolate dehydrogenase [Camelimonas fluminis]GHE51685.1 malate/lactate/ureidoglycolate dehydrogenase [Camelimonas fluminis]
MTTVADSERLKSFVTTLFQAVGSNSQEALEIADHLVEANLAGHDSHGVGMIPAYFLHLRAGHVKPNQTPQRIGGDGAFARFDGLMGYGQPAANRVMEEAAAIARAHGVAVTTLCNAQHIGRVGAYAERLQAEGLMSLHFVNAVYHTPTVAPYRGSDARVMTNPVCIGVPGATPLLLDFATATIALGKVRVAYNKGVAAPEGSLIDNRGQPTTNPAVMFEEPRGAQTAFGLHKGWALAFMAEALGGVMTGGPRSGDGFAGERGLVNGIMSIVIDPARLVDAQWLDAAMATLADYVKASPAADPQAPVQVPGEAEELMRAERRRNGIPIDPKTWSQILACAAPYGLRAPV